METRSKKEIKCNMIFSTRSNTNKKCSPTMQRVMQSQKTHIQKNSPSIIEQFRTTIETLEAELIVFENDVKQLKIENRLLSERAETAEAKLKEMQDTSKIKNVTGVTNGRKNYSELDAKTTTPIRISNRFNGLLETEDEVNICPLTPIKKPRIRRKPRIRIVSDSHGRKLSSLLQSAKPQHKIIGTTMPGAKAESILQNLNQDTSDFEKDEHVVIIAGANDLYSNEFHKAELILRKTLDNLKTPNTLIVGIPHRYDLITESCVNIKIKSANLELKKICNLYNCKFIELDSVPRSGFTRHGLHLNNLGKEILSNLISKQITSFFQKPLNLNLNVSPQLNNR